MTQGGLMKRHRRGGDRGGLVASFSSNYSSKRHLDEERLDIQLECLARVQLFFYQTFWKTITLTWISLFDRTLRSI